MQPGSSTCVQHLCLIASVSSGSSSSRSGNRSFEVTGFPPPTHTLTLGEYKCMLGVSVYTERAFVFVCACVRQEGERERENVL